MPSSAPPFKIIFDDERLECPDSRLLIVAVQSALCIATCALTYPDKEIFEDDSTQFPLFVGGSGTTAWLTGIAFDSHTIILEIGYQRTIGDEESNYATTAKIELFPGNDDDDSWSTDDELSSDEQYMMHDAEEER